jgi:hypothetical protein
MSVFSRPGPKVSKRRVSTVDSLMASVPDRYPEAQDGLNAYWKESIQLQADRVEAAEEKKRRRIAAREVKRGVGDTGCMIE